MRLRKCSSKLVSREPFFFSFWSHQFQLPADWIGFVRESSAPKIGKTSFITCKYTHKVTYLHHELKMSQIGSFFFAHICLGKKKKKEIYSIRKRCIFLILSSFLFSLSRKFLLANQIFLFNAFSLNFFLEYHGFVIVCKKIMNLQSCTWKSAKPKMTSETVTTSSSLKLWNAWGGIPGLLRIGDGIIKCLQQGSPPVLDFIRLEVDESRRSKANWKEWREKRVIIVYNGRALYANGKIDSYPPVTKSWSCFDQTGGPLFLAEKRKVLVNNACRFVARD